MNLKSCKIEGYERFFNVVTQRKKAAEAHLFNKIPILIPNYLEYTTNPASCCGENYNYVLE